MSVIDLREGIRVVDGGVSGAVLECPNSNVRVRVDDEVLGALRGSGSEPFRVAVAAVLRRLQMASGVVEPEPPRSVPLPSRGRVDIVIPNLNGGEMLQRCLTSVAGQTHPPATVVVVDGGSTDASLEIAVQAGATWIDVPRGTGFAAACNAGAATADGDYILILNNDVVLEFDFLAQILAVAEEWGDAVAAVAPMVRRADIPAVVESIGNVLGTRGFGAGRHAGLVDLGQLPPTEEIFSAPFTAALLRRSVWRAIGGMDERFDFYYEDVEWSTRARLAGGKVVTASRAIAYHEGSASLGEELSPRKLRMVTRNRLLWAESTLRTRTMGRFCLSYVREDARRAAHGLVSRDLATAGAVVAAWAGNVTRIPATYRRRKQTLRNHTLPMSGLLGLAASPAPLYDADGALLLSAEAVRRSYIAAAIASGVASGGREVSAGG